ncbi:major facilitator superfamily domain-containing protein [Phycomyces blakesleeanus]
MEKIAVVKGPCAHGSDSETSTVNEPPVLGPSITTQTVSVHPYLSRHGDIESNVMPDEKKVTVHYVNWEENDPENPNNWPARTRWMYTMLVASLVVSAAFSSSVVTGRLQGPMEDFGVSKEISILQVSLMVFGFMIGPLLWSPLSELYGRKPIYVCALFIYVIFNIPCAVAKNIETLLVCRFFSGFFASAGLTIAGGSISDLFHARERGNAIAYFAAAPYAGPVLGPIVGGWISVGTQSWRWIYWVNMMLAGVLWVLICLMPETYHPVLLARRAKRLRQETGDPSYVTVEEEFPTPLSELLRSNLIRPFEMIVTEPILLLMSMYISIIYALLYAFFFAYPIIFADIHHMNDGEVGVTFCGVLVGTFLALLVTPWLERVYQRSGEKNPTGEPTPENRLPGMMLAAPFIPVSLFIFGWTSFSWVHWFGPVSSGIPFGFGMVLVYYSANNYIIDCFPRYVTSALAAKTLVRSGTGAAFPLFIIQMYHGMGNQWASTLLAFISLAIVPIPYAFYFYGARIRARSKTATH